jgi:hypothetical protein
MSARAAAAARCARGGFAVLALALGGCPRAAPSPCAPSAPAVLEVRDGAGALQAALKRSETAGARVVCDAGAHKIGTVVDDAAGMTALDARGALVLRVRTDADGDLLGDGAQGPRLRVHRDGRELRVLRPDGVPYGSIAPHDAAGAVVFGPGGQPIATVGARGVDQVLAQPSGATTAYVTPSSRPVAAGAFALEGLSLAERLALYLALAR